MQATARAKVQALFSALTPPACSAAARASILDRRKFPILSRREDSRPASATAGGQSCPNRRSQSLSLSRARSHTHTPRFAMFRRHSVWRFLILERVERAARSEKCQLDVHLMHLDAKRDKWTRARVPNGLCFIQLILTAWRGWVERVAHLSPTSLPVAVLRPLLSLPAPLLAPHSPFCDAYSHFMLRTQPGGGWRAGPREHSAVTVYVKCEWKTGPELTDDVSIAVLR